jgi:signal transduction histidine kinase
VALTAQEAGRALAFGVDEVIRVGELTDETLSTTIARASARAVARSSYESRRSLLQDDDELAVASLAAAFGHGLAEPLATASLDCQFLASVLSALLSVDDQFVAWTALVAPIEQVRQLAARRLALPPSRELKQLLADIMSSLQRASALASGLGHLAAGTGANSPAPIAQLVAEVIEVLRSDVRRYATVTLKTEGACAVCVAPITVAMVVTTLLGNAVDAIRAARRDEGRIEVRLSECEDSVVLEVQDNGQGALSDLRPTVFEPYFSVSRTHRTGLVRLRERLRRCGGDVMVDADSLGTMVRVLFPSAAEDVIFEREGKQAMWAKKGPSGAH